MVRFWTVYYTLGRYVWAKGLASGTSGSSRDANTKSSKRVAFAFGTPSSTIEVTSGSPRAPRSVVSVEPVTSNVTASMTANPCE